MSVVIFCPQLHYFFLHSVNYIFQLQSLLVQRLLVLLDVLGTFPHVLVQ